MSPDLLDNELLEENYRKYCLLFTCHHENKHHSLAGASSSISPNPEIETPDRMPSSFVN